MGANWLWRASSEGKKKGGYYPSKSDWSLCTPDPFLTWTVWSTRVRPFSHQYITVYSVRADAQRTGCIPYVVLGKATPPAWSHPPSNNSQPYTKGQGQVTLQVPCLSWCAPQVTSVRKPTVSLLCYQPHGDCGDPASGVDLYEAQHLHLGPRHLGATKRSILRCFCKWKNVLPTQGTLMNETREKSSANCQDQEPTTPTAPTPYPGNHGMFPAAERWHLGQVPSKARRHWTGSSVTAGANDPSLALPTAPTHQSKQPAEYVFL